LLWGAFRIPSFCILILAVFCMFIGMLTPIFYLPTYATQNGMDQTLASYLLAILNGSSTLGRIIPGILADRFGRLNILAAAACSTGIILLRWPHVYSTAGLVVYAVVFGFCSGAIISGSSATFAICPKDPRDIGAYMGMAMAIASLAALIGPPANGALLDMHQSFEQVSILSGVICLDGGVITLGSKATTPQGLLGKY
jgi:MFS family permease